VEHGTSRPRAAGEPTSGNAYADWARSQDESYRADAARPLIAEVPANECDVASAAQNLKTAEWRLAVGVKLCMPFVGQVSGHAGSGGIPPPDNSLIVPCFPAQLEAPLSAGKMPVLPSLVACLHAVERVPSAGRGKPTQFIPIRFIFTNKLTKDDRLLLGFDALVLSEALGRDIAVGQIIHGEDHTKLKAKNSALAKRKSAWKRSLPYCPARHRLTLSSTGTAQSVSSRFGAGRRLSRRTISVCWRA
jgi:hypothetical protein